jgi:membrane protease YdiL (CAAX protease family)
MQSASPGTDNPGTMPNSTPVENGNPIPYWHTAVLLLVLVLFSLGNIHRSQAMSSGHANVRIYLATMAYEWLLTAYVWWGLRRSGGSLRELIGGRWRSIGDLFRDMMIAAGVWLGALVVIAIAAALAALAMHMDQTGDLNDTLKRIGFLTPQSNREVILWLCLSATAGFCEEVLFRGYLQKQFTRLLRSRWSALVVVSILFGLGHGYEGLLSMAKIVLLGLAFGLVSLSRKSLRPAMMAHTWQDAITGLVLRSGVLRTLQH